MAKENKSEEQKKYFDRLIQERSESMMQVEKVKQQSKELARLKDEYIKTHQKK